MRIKKFDGRFRKGSLIPIKKSSHQYSNGKEKDNSLAQASGKQTNQNGDLNRKL